MGLCSENFIKWHRIFLDAPLEDGELKKTALCHLWHEICLFLPEGSAIRAAAEERMPEFLALQPDDLIL